MHGGWQVFSPTLLMEVEGSILKMWVTLYALVSVWRRGEREKHMRVLARLTGRTGRGMVWRGEAMGAGTQSACEWSTEIQPKAS
jgi:hypothetical protein